MNIFPHDSFVFPDVLPFLENRNDEMEVSFTEIMPSESSYFAQGLGPEASIDRSSFLFPMGLTPLDTPTLESLGELPCLPSPTWREDHQMLDVAGYLIPQHVATEQMQPSIVVDPNFVDSDASDTLLTNGQNHDNSLQQNSTTSPAEPAKPKRGRPRKSRRKKVVSPEEKIIKRAKFLERNRQAAKKCRDRKKRWAQDVMDKLSKEERKYVALEMEFNRLFGEATSLITAAQKHPDHCTENNNSFQNTLSLSTDRLADIDQLYLHITGNLEDLKEEESEEDDDVSIADSDEPPRKRSQSESQRTSSILESVQKPQDLSYSTVDLVNQEVEAQSPLVCQDFERRGSEHIFNSSAISIRSPPINSESPLLADEDFFGAEDCSRFIAPMTLNYSTSPVTMMPNPRLPSENTRAKLDALLSARHFSWGKDRVGSIVIASRS